MKVTSYVDSAGGLVVIDTGEHLRRASPSERRESYADAHHGSATGAISAEVSARTLKRRAPQYWGYLVSVGKA